MNTAKHTPGPWEVTGPHTCTVITTNPGTYRPCMTIANVSGYWDGEAQANAHLIAAAPAMYEALRDCVGRLEAYYGDTYPAVIRGKQALAQAEGK